VVKKNFRIVIEGDALSILREIPDETFQCAITSPPYWGLRDYGVDGEIGKEKTVEEYLENLNLIFEEIKRVLKQDGTFWLNMGDTYTSGGRKWRAPDKKNPARHMNYRPDTPDGLKEKELIGIAWRMAFILQKSGWYLRSDIIWNKPNCMPESVKDRPTKSHEYIFLLTKSPNYLYNNEVIMEVNGDCKKRNRRTVWNINTEAFNGSHFATFPPALVEVCLKAGSNKGDLVIDPFFGAGTVGLCANKLGRGFVGIELNPNYVSLTEERLAKNKIKIKRYMSWKDVK